MSLLLATSLSRYSRYVATLATSLILAILANSRYSRYIATSRFLATSRYVATSRIEVRSTRFTHATGDLLRELHLGSG